MPNASPPAPAPRRRAGLGPQGAGTGIGPLTPHLFTPTPARPLRAKIHHLTTDQHVLPHSHPWAQLSYASQGVLDLYRREDTAYSLTLDGLGAGAHTVALTVLDTTGRQLCSDTSGGAVLACRIPAGGGPLVARVANRGSDATDVLLLMN